jgi:hypothetical protein
MHKILINISLAVILSLNFQGTVQSVENSEVVTIENKKSPMVGVAHLEFANDLVTYILRDLAIPALLMGILWTGSTKEEPTSKKWQLAITAIGLYCMLNGAKDLARGYQRWKAVKKNNQLKKALNRAKNR